MRQFSYFFLKEAFGTVLLVFFTLFRTFAAIYILKMMKKTITAAVLLAAALGAHAEGYQVNTYSARQEGMGHTGTALTLGAESQLFNPAAMVFSDKTFEVSGSITAAVSKATAVHEGNSYETDNPVSTPMNVCTSFRIFDNFYGGLSFFTPYGSAINWGDNWPGAVLNQKVSIKVFSLQPTLAYKILPNLSIGAGMSMNWGSVDLDKGLMTGVSMNKFMAAIGMPPTAMYAPNVTPASVNLTGKSNIAVGYNLGALWQINRQWNVGVSFRGKTTLTVKKGDAQVRYNGDAQTLLEPVLDNLNRTNFRASLPCPYVLSFGVAYKPIENVTIAADVQLNGWKAYDQLDIEFDNLSDFDQHLTKNYRNAMTYHAGVQWGCTRRLDLRAGLMVDTNPCDKGFYNPETPGQTRIEPSVGFSFRPVGGLSIDFALMYVHGCGTDGATGQYEDFVYKMAAKVNPALPGQLGLTPMGTFTADYKVSAWLPALGLSYAF